MPGEKKFRLRGGIRHKISVSSLYRLLAEVVERSGKCDVLVNGAGINAPTPFLDIPEDEYDRIFDVNTKSVFLACQVFGEYFLAKGIEASVINVGSMSGVIPLSRVFTYSMTKAAMISMTKAYAKELAPKGIRVNALLPGLTETKFAGALIENDDIYKGALKSIPMARHAQPEEMAGAVLYLVSDASSFTTGTHIICDGGALA